MMKLLLGITLTFASTFSVASEKRYKTFSKGLKGLYQTSSCKAFNSAFYGYGEYAQILQDENDVLTINIIGETSYCSYGIAETLSFPYKSSKFIKSRVAKNKILNIGENYSVEKINKSKIVRVRIPVSNIFGDDTRETCDLIKVKELPVEIDSDESCN